MKELDFEVTPDGMVEARGENNEMYIIFEGKPEKTATFNGEDIYKSKSLLDCIIFCNKHYNDNPPTL